MINLFISILFVAYIQQLPDSFDSKMREYNLVDVQELNSDILVDLKYSTTDNFVGVDMYGDLETAYLEREFAKRVVRAQQLLQQRHPEYTLLIYDAARPISVQRTMRKIVEGTELEDFVADGTRGGRHNYGVAVDLTIATLDGTPLNMGAGFDDFTEAASVKGTADSSDPATRTVKVYRDYINNLAKRGVISREAAANRILLIEVMHEAGLYPYRLEWWHYEEIMSIQDTRKRYKLLDF
jgi:D-alanyl-D-alanine dipeptidase